MKKTIFFFVLSLMGISQAVAQEYEYVPFVREGVKWVYFYNNDFASNVFDMPEGIQYYSFEMEGVVLINDKLYKPVKLTHYFDSGGRDKEMEDFIPVYLREEDKVVYAIHPDGIQHPKCPVAIDRYIGYPSQGLPLTTSSEEFILYDFNDPKAFYDTFFEVKNISCEFEGLGPYVEYLNADTMIIGNHRSKCHHLKSLYDIDNKIIEGIGYDGTAGMPLFYFEIFIAGLGVKYYLSHVIEDGEIIYKSINYNPDIQVAIDEVDADKTRLSLDPRYYDLMGRVVGTEVPTTPGIYIHQGKKICVSRMP